ncbi:MAG: hypothetical protein HFP81_00125 [Methylococcales symbiont of Hymedesmia sp. n. MRB-2018]|nr:MAG: hypothetical protein HFP78_00135 [Methylococcales symbiont of Hymedesmia sp. n. MRB-2018]KAF3984828.1 MAG: hypothetical protein HFP81_00125 [Methylococcales symbiont of Hymedesmia sp. n. MRB-2018]
MYQLLPKSEWQHKAVAIKTNKPTGSALKREDAKQQISQYYQEHKAQFPASIRQQREKIIELIMDGVPVEEAFKQCIYA